MDISSLCRGCMKEVEAWEKENINVIEVDMFCYCTKIEVHYTPDDKLPKQFCYSCKTKIQTCYDFIKEAQKVDTELKKLGSRTATVIIEPDKLKHEGNYLKLTLPDYKICTTIENDNRSSLEAIDNNQYDDSFEKSDENGEKIHLKNESESNFAIVEKNNICPVCRKCFVSKIWYDRHILKEHSRKFSCSQCSKIFLKSSQLTHHVAYHSEERRFACNVCGKRFKWRKHLTIHNRTHVDIRPFACDKCDMRFKIKSVLKCHLKVHEEQKQYLCSFCGWSFSQAGNLEVHIRKHTGDKPFRCAQCPFRASVVSNLRRHERVHSGTKTHTCLHCRKGFYDAGSLARHTRTHTGELPYKCPGCERAFADSWKRKTHLMRSHRMELQDIPRMTRDGLAIHT